MQRRCERKYGKDWDRVRNLATGRYCTHHVCTVLRGRALSLHPIRLLGKLQVEGIVRLGQHVRAAHQYAHCESWTFIYILMCKQSVDYQ